MADGDKPDKTAWRVIAEKTALPLSGAIGLAALSFQIGQYSAGMDRKFDGQAHVDERQNQAIAHSATKDELRALGWDLREELRGLRSQADADRVKDAAKWRLFKASLPPELRAAVPEEGR